MPAEDAALLRQILRERILAGDLPDFPLVRAQGLILVQASPHVDVTAAIPDVPGLTFATMSLAEAEARARRTRRPVYFLMFSTRPLITGDTAEVMLGTAMVPVPGSGAVLCCCERIVRYLRSRSDNAWRFLGWGMGMCA